jgi:hypothetical protein
MSMKKMIYEDESKGLIIKSTPDSSAKKQSQNIKIF